MNKMRSIVLSWMLVVVSIARGQQYTGIEGLIHVPTADMDTVGVARIGAQFMPKYMVPDAMKCDEKKFNSCSNYLSLTPFKWISVGYGYTLWKLHKNSNPQNKTGFYSKDRYFSVKLQPVAEKRWWPSIVVGGNDVWGSNEKGRSGSNYFRNYYAAASKHVDLSGWRLGAHVAYRYWWRDFNHKWNGVVGGITLQPPFYKPLRAMVEWDGHGVNVGIDCRYKIFQFQCALVDGKYFTGGLSLYVKLLNGGGLFKGKKRAKSQEDTPVSPQSESETM